MAGIIFPDVAGSVLPALQIQKSQQLMDLEAARQRKLDADQARLDSAGQYVGAAVNGDPEAAANLARTNPGLFTQVQTLISNRDDKKLKQAQENAKWLAGASGAVLEAPPEERATAYAQHLAELKARGIDAGSMPQTYSPAVDAYLRYHLNSGVSADKYLETHLNTPQPMPAPGATPGTAAPVDAAGNAISGIESKGAPNGGYGAVGPSANSAGNRAYGKYQVMDFNIPTWTAEALGKPMTPQEFLANPQAQDAVFKTKFGQLAQKYGPEGAARAWFAGEGGMNNPGAADVNGMTVANYGKQFVANGGGAPQVAQAAPAPPMPQGGDQPTGNQPGVMPPPAVAPPPPAQMLHDYIQSVVPGARGMGTPKGGYAYDHAGNIRVILPNGQETAIPPMPRADKGQFEDIRQNPNDPNSPIIAQRNTLTNELHPRNMAGQLAIPPEVANLHEDALKASPWYQSLPVTVRNNAEGLVSGDLPISTLSKRAGGGSDFNTIVGVAQQLKPGWTPNEGTQKALWEKQTFADSNSKNYQARQAINIAPEHAVDLVKITDAINQQNPQAVQNIVNKLKQQFGDTAVPDMNAARNLVALEFLRAAVGPAALNQSLEKAFIESIPTGATSDQVRRIIGSYVDKLQSRANEMQDTGDAYGSTKKIISPRTQEALDYLKGPKRDAQGAPVAPTPSMWDRVFGGASSPAPGAPANSQDALRKKYGLE